MAETMTASATYFVEWAIGAGQARALPNDLRAIRPGLSLVPLEFPLSPMMGLAVKIELANMVPVQGLCTPIRANIVGPPCVPPGSALPWPPAIPGPRAQPSEASLM